MNRTKKSYRSMTDARSERQANAFSYRYLNCQASPQLGSKLMSLAGRVDSISRSIVFAPTIAPTTAPITAPPATIAVKPAPHAVGSKQVAPDTTKLERAMPTPTAAPPAAPQAAPVTTPPTTLAATSAPRLTVLSALFRQDFAPSAQASGCSTVGPSFAASRKGSASARSAAGDDAHPATKVPAMTIITNCIMAAADFKFQARTTNLRQPMLRTGS